MNLRRTASATIAVTIVAAAHIAAGSSDWTVIKPGLTTQDEIVAAFGPPDEVTATFPWSEWSAKWKKRPLSSRYTLRYTRQMSRSALLDGPAGPADSVEVPLADGRVITVVWEYGGPSARAAVAKIRKDPEMIQAPLESGLLSASKSVTNGWLMIEFARDESSVRARFELK